MAIKPFKIKLPTRFGQGVGDLNLLLFGCDLDGVRLG
jgi:hypothetical protein